MTNLVKNVTIPNGFDLNSCGQESQPEKSLSLLERLQSVSSEIKQKAAQKVVFTPPIISRDGLPTIKRGTLVGIQGRFGSHKSRIGELFCSVVISTLPQNDTKHLGYSKHPLERIVLVHIDTERNTKEELPQTIQSIRKKAGFNAFAEVPDFYYTSIKTIPRAKRLEAVKEYLEYVRSQTDGHIFCVLDVLTDCVSDFNDAKDSLALCDFLNNLCENENATIVGIIHENPGSEKARGHLGTEFANKSSTFFQIGFVRDGNGNDTDVIRLRYLKVRSIKRPNSLYLTYSAEIDGLILAPSEMLASVEGSTRRYDANDIAEILEDYLTSTPVSQTDLLAHLKAETKLSKNPIMERLAEIERKGKDWVLHDSSGAACYLKINRLTGKATTYQLSPIEAVETDQ
ncbi:MAG: hypothetical protein EAZ26_10490 [Runella slithyformis]|nr:MAG: hypothetical protein EAZ26_10490 [Runella slithyformis]